MGHLGCVCLTSEPRRLGLQPRQTAPGSPAARGIRAGCRKSPPPPAPKSGRGPWHVTFFIPSPALGGAAGGAAGGIVGMGSGSSRPSAVRAGRCATITPAPMSAAAPMRDMGRARRHQCRAAWRPPRGRRIPRTSPRIAGGPTGRLGADGISEPRRATQEYQAWQACTCIAH